jgi:6,7-dimethyl-8-ribityllumazine synthase
MAEQRRAHVIDDRILHGARVLIIDARFHEAIADELVAGATEYLTAAHVHVDRASVPGALEIPIAAAIELEAARRADQRLDAIVALGCVIRGATAHFDIVAHESARALMEFAMANHMPVGNGILTVDTEAQARERASRSGGNKGAAAAEAALTLLQISRKSGQRHGVFR